MELKKYVLLSDNIIVDVSKENYYLTQKGLIRYRENAVMQKTLMGTVKSTSDNILDLVEVGDLVELNGGDGNDNDVHMIVNVIDGDMITLDKLWVYKERDKDAIVAIYKRQTNGDYKRYELGKELERYDTKRSVK